jgi:Fe-S cluster assembly protein SufD
MMTEQQAALNEFDIAIESLIEQAIGNDALSLLRKKSKERFQQLGLPERKSEHFRYVNIHRLYNLNFAPIPPPSELSISAFESYIYPECANSVLVFVNGSFQPELSRMSALPEKLVVARLSDAMRSYGALLTNNWTKSTKEEEDPFVALNGAGHGEGAFVYLPPKLVCNVPIQLLYLVDSGNQPSIISPRLQLLAGPHSSIELISSSFKLSGEGCLINQVTDLALEENSQVHYYQASSNNLEDMWHLDATRATLKRDSRLKTVWATKGTAATRNDYKIVLAGENSEASLNGVWRLNERRESHCHVYIDHRAPNATSNQLFKGVLDDVSRSSFEGQIVVQQEAQKTNAFQLNNNLVLSEGAQADSSPNLRIFADDVKASHGATVGQLPPEELFYMQTRGLKTAEAQKILIEGYCKQVTEMFPLDCLKEI